ncbi:hypothetical protein MBLNU230_g0320t1 [Neophaeotheca triangularis]
MLTPLTLTLTLASCIQAACECGYSINSTSDPQHALFTHVFESDFLHLPDITWNTTHNTGWQPQEYTVSPPAARGPYGKSAQLDNIIPNPFLSPHDWGGSNSETEHGPTPGLQLWVRSAPIPSPNDSADRLIPMAELATLRSDILYGSFRFGAKTPSQPGTCAAFFFYANDEQEIDMELLSSQQQHQDHQDQHNRPKTPINLVLHAPNPAHSPSEPQHTLHPLPFAPGSGYHEYRFDWLPSRIDFYFDGVWAASFTDTSAVPSTPGRILLNHWANGDENWSGGPPERDAVVGLSYFKGYFNVSGDEGLEGREMGCLGHVCVVPDQEGAPGVEGEGGNGTGRTFFFTELEVERGDEGEGGGTTGIGGRVEAGLMGLCFVVLARLLWGLG